MKDLNNEVLGLIEDTVVSERELTIDSLRKSNVSVDTNITDRDLFTLVTDELNKGNGYLIYHFGEVLSKKVEPQSNFDFALNPSALGAASQAASQAPSIPTSQPATTSGGGFGNWLQNNSGLISTGANILGGFLFGGGSGSSQAPQSTANQNTSLAQFQYASQQAQLEKDRWAMEQKARDEMDRSRTNTIILVSSIIGGVLILGTIITVALVKKN